VPLAERGRFLLEYIDLLTNERVREEPGFRHSAERSTNQERSTSNEIARGHDRWVINKIRALGSWYTKGLDNGSHFRTALNTAESLDQLRDIIAAAFSAPTAEPRSESSSAAPAAALLSS
jgi:hypothetical protein